MIKRGEGLYVSLTLLIFAILFYVDFWIITPHVLPKDQCYYHTHETPFWVDLLYMNEGSNNHPEWSITHLLILLVISITLGRLARRKINSFNVAD